MEENKDLKKSVDPVSVAMLATAAVVAYPAAKEIIRDIRNTQKDKEEKF